MGMSTERLSAIAMAPLARTTRQRSYHGNGEGLFGCGGYAISVRRLLVTVVVGMAAVTSAAAQSDDPWLLLGIDVNMGPTITVRGPNEVAGLNPISGEGYRTFPTYAACEAAMRQTILRYHGRSHAGGEFGSYLCTNWEKWQR